MSALTREEEQKLIDRVLEGDVSAFEPLVTEYSKKIYNLALRMTRNPADAEDISQEAFLKAFKSLSHFRRDSGFYAWIYRITSNLCIDFLRREKLRSEEPLVQLGGDGEERELELPDLRALPEEMAQQQELREALREGFNALPAPQRQILTLRDLGGLSYGEIATVLELEEGTVKSRISRARAALAKLLSESGNLFEDLSSKKAERG